MKNLITRELDEMISSSELRNLMLNIGAAIRKLRIQKGYKCAEYFAFQYQLNRSAYYGWENGKNISIKKLILVCEALDISLLEFFQFVKIPVRIRKIRKAS
ncbi:MAG: helix-turn-helix transcriptional regulator [Bacteroidota bacterium]